MSMLPCSFDLKKLLLVIASGLGILLLSALVVLVSGCSSGGATSPATPAAAASISTAPASSASPAPASPAIGEYSIAVFSGDKQLADLKIIDLQKLAQVTVATEGGDETGPTLLSVFNSVGIQYFTSVTAYGMTKGRVATTELTLTKDKIDNTVVLGMNNRGTAKLTGKNISAATAVIDLNKLVVK
jgi:hypothetical protein